MMKYDLRSNPCLVKVSCFLFKFVHIEQTGCYTMKRRQLKEIVICPKYLGYKIFKTLPEKVIKEFGKLFKKFKSQ